MTSPIESHRRVKYMRTKSVFFSRGIVGEKDKTVDCKKAFGLPGALFTFLFILLSKVI